LPETGGEVVSCWFLVVGPLLSAGAGAVDEASGRGNLKLPETEEVSSFGQANTGQQRGWPICDEWEAVVSGEEKNNSNSVQRSAISSLLSPENRQITQRAGGRELVALVKRALVNHGKTR
jgi:hypothetical protein